MAAIPSAINLLDTHLSAGAEAGKPSSLLFSTYSPIVDSSDKEQLVDVDLEEEDQGQPPPSGTTAERGDIRWQRNKIWPFRVLKVANWFLLLAIAIGATVCANYRINWWSDYWKTVAIFRDRPYDLSTEYATGQWILLGLASVSLLAHWLPTRQRSSHFLAALLALMDLCISALCVPLLLVALTYFSIQTLAEFRWFLPKLAHLNDSTEASADLTSVYAKDYISGDINQQWIRELMEDRKWKIMLHLIVDPGISFLSALAILFNIALIVCVYKMMRRTNIWANIAEQDKRLSAFDRHYARHYPFGMLKTFQWLLPTAALFAFLYIPLFRIHYQDDQFLVLLGLVSLACFGHWLLYFCSVHLRHAAGIPATAFRLDCLVSLSSLMVFGNYLFGRRMMEPIHWGGIAMFLTSLALLSLLLLRHNQQLQLFPCISVQIHVNFVPAVNNGHAAEAVAAAAVAGPKTGSGGEQTAKD